MLNYVEMALLYRSYLKICAEVQSSLAKEKAQYESDLEENIISPLQNIADVSKIQNF